jgi:putative tricarboxylic transport membrane protein
MIDRPIAAIIFALILLVLALHVRVIIKEWRAHQRDEDHDLHDSQTR